MKRTNEVFVLLTLSLCGAIAITPFAVIRLLNREWSIGLVDSILVVSMLAIGLYVYVTRKVHFASVTLTVLALAGLTIVIHLKGPSLLFWAYPTMVGAYFLLGPHLAVKLTSFAILAILSALVNQMAAIEVAMVIITLVVNNLFAYVFTKRMSQQREQLSKLASQDPLTGAGNRRAFDVKLEELIAFHHRTEQITSLIALDVDHFKSVNDSYGHGVGDQVLIKLTELVNKRIRATDSFYRVGGEEFIVVLVGTGLDNARDVAEELRLIIESSEMIENKVVTVSLGVAEYIADETASNWLGRGDKALYQAKESGRNMTCIAV